MKKRFFLIGLFIMVNIIYAMPNVEDVMIGIDKVTSLESDATAKVKITQKRIKQGIKVFESIYYLRDSDDSFLIIMTEPEFEKGNGYLRVEDNFWMYRRNTRTFQHINRDESIAGSDSSAEDFENRKMIETYKPMVDESGNEIISEGKLGKMEVYRVEIVAKVDDVSYPKRILWVRRDNYLPLKEENYSLSGTLMQTVYYPKYTKVKGKYVWIKAIFIDEFEEGNQTLVELSNISLDDVEDYVFTKAYLENLSK